MEDEAEELQRELFALRARVTELERDAGLPLSVGPGSAGMGMGPGGFGGRRGGFDMGPGGFRGRGRGPPGMGAGMGMGMGIGGFKRPFGDRDGVMGRGGFMPLKRIR